MTEQIFYTAARGILEVLDNDVWIGKLLECAGPVTALAKPQQYLDAYSQDVWEKTCEQKQKQIQLLSPAGSDYTLCNRLEPAITLGVHWKDMEPGALMSMEI